MLQQIDLLRSSFLALQTYTICSVIEHQTYTIRTFQRQNCHTVISFVLDYSNEFTTYQAMFFIVYNYWSTSIFLALYPTLLLFCLYFFRVLKVKKIWLNTIVPRKSEDGKRVIVKQKTKYAGIYFEQFLQQWEDDFPQIHGPWVT